MAPAVCRTLGRAMSTMGTDGHAHALAERSGLTRGAPRSQCQSAPARAKGGLSPGGKQLTRQWQAPPSSRQPRRGVLHVRNVGWDPEGLLAPPQPGHIARRRMQKKSYEEGLEEQKQLELQQREAARLEQKRMAREVPEGDGALLDHFLKLEAEEGEEELAYEAARCGGRLTDSFFATLRGAMGTIRFAARRTEDDLARLQRLEKLEGQLLEQVEAQKIMREAVLAAKERLHGLLSAPDKKQKILAMAAAGELDLSLLGLLDENIVAAQNAQQASAVEFMEKIRAAVVKYMSMEQLQSP